MQWFLYGLRFLGHGLALYGAVEIGECVVAIAHGILLFETIISFFAGADHDA